MLVDKSILIPVKSDSDLCYVYWSAVDKEYWTMNIFLSIKIISVIKNVHSRWADWHKNTSDSKLMLLFIKLWGQCSEIDIIRISYVRYFRLTVTFFFVKIEYWLKTIIQNLFLHGYIETISSGWTYSNSDWSIVILNINSGKTQTFISKINMPLF